MLLRKWLESSKSKLKGIDKRAFSTFYVWKDIPYMEKVRSQEHHRRQTLDVYIPSEPFPRQHLPVCFYVPGGSWQVGGKTTTSSTKMMELCTGEGYVSLSAEYRLSPEITHPNHVRDLVAALKWVHDNIHQYGGDARKVLLVGHSAGAHLIMFLLTNPSFLEEVESGQQLQSMIVGVVGVSGVYDLVRLASNSLYGEWILEPVFGNEAFQWREASPLHCLDHLAEETRKTLSFLDLPVLLLNADNDFGLEEDGQNLCSKLISLGNSDVEHHVIKDRNHWSIVTNVDGREGSTETTAQLLRSFFSRVTS